MPVLDLVNHQRSRLNNIL